MMVSPRSERAGSMSTHPDDCASSNGCDSKDHVSLSLSTSRKGLLTDEKSPSDFSENSTSFSSKFKLPKFSHKSNISAVSAGFQRIGKGKDEIPFSTPASTSERLKKQFKKVLFSQIDWPAVAQMCKIWVRKPLSMVLLLWIVCVVVSGAILFLVMTGMLNRVLPKKSQRDIWFEVNNQIINALFTLMCLYQHPKRVHHLVLLCRWKPEDMICLRKIYCKNGTYKPNDRAHMTVVILLLHVNCFAQYALCALNLGYKRINRPIIGVAICLSVAIVAPAVAGLYSMLSPLGKDYDCDIDEEAPNHLCSEKNFLVTEREKPGIVDNTPNWRGTIFHLWQDFSVAYLSLICCFCVFGWNMERLGFGNMYVHVVTFLLICTAPFWIFSLAAVNIENETIREILGITGVALCVFGLLYGGFWRTRMRKRFNLPPNNFCCGKPDVTDCAQWLFCCWCSLAQEVRTGDFYNITEHRFDRQQSCSVHDSHTPMTPLPREGSVNSQLTPDIGSSTFMNPASSKIKPSTDEMMSPPMLLKMKVAG